MISRDLGIGRALRARQRGFLLNPFRFGVAPPASPVLPPISDENSTFNDEGDATTGWTATNAVLSVSGSYLRATKSAAGGANMTKAATFTPTNRDWILYGKMRGSSASVTDHSVIWFLNGTKEASLWLGSTSGGTGVAGTNVIGSVSLVGTTGTSTYNRATVAASGVDYTTQPFEFALQYDSKFTQLVCWIRQSDGRWKLGARVACNWFSATSIQVLKGGSSAAGTWVEFDYLTLCKPNIVAIGDSICAGATLFNPNRTSGLSNDESSWMRHAPLYPSRRNNLIVNKGVGSQTSAQIQARIAEATGESPRVVFLMASSNDEDQAVSKSTRTTSIQSSVNSINAAGAKAVILNSVYGTDAGADNTPTNDLRDYMLDWWTTYLPTVSGQYSAIDIMDPVRVSGDFQDPAVTQSDGIHPTPAGYELIGEYIASKPYGT